MQISTAGSSSQVQGQHVVPVGVKGSVQLETISPLRQACNNIIPAKCRLAILPMVTGRSGSKAANDLMLCLPYLRYVFWRANLSAKVHESPEIVKELSFRQ